MQKFPFLVIGAVLLLAAGCSKNNEKKPESNLFSVYLTDNPAELDAINIDIHSVEIKIDENSAGDEKQIAQMDKNRDNDSLGALGGTLWNGGIPVRDSDKYGKWVSLNFTPGAYNILQLRNGIEMLLGTVETLGDVRKIRIAVGSGSSVIKAGKKYPLTLMDDSVNHNIYIDVLKESRVQKSDGSLAVYLDFDLGRSITENDGHYFLFPYLRTLTANRSLEVEGYALPAAANVLVSIYNDTDTATALPDGNGYFKIRGLTLGNYNVQYHAGNSAYRDTTVRGLDINLNKVTLAPMTLSKY